MSVHDKFNSFKLRVYNEAHSARGKNVLLYLMFVVVAFVFWLLLSLDTEVQRDFDVPVVVENVPDSVTFISVPPATINVAVTAKGSQLLQFRWGNTPTLKLNFNDYVAGDNVWAVTSNKLESRVRDCFGNSIIINAVRPDSMRLDFTRIPGEPMALVIDSEVTPNMQCIISGKIRANVDSVMVYSIHPIHEGLVQAITEPIVRRDLKDTTYVEVPLHPIAGYRFIPDRVRVTIPVEPLIAKRQVVRVGSMNLPDDVSIITFPSEVTVSYLVPMSRYNDEYPIDAYVDFDDVLSSSTHLPINFSLLPQYISNISVSPDSVEYVIEHLHQ